MVTFFVAMMLLFADYHTYGRLSESLFRPDDRPTPAVDSWKCRPGRYF